jgi:hypothetical protein
MSKSKTTVNSTVSVDKQEFVVMAVALLRGLLATIGFFSLWYLILPAGWAVAMTLVSGTVINAYLMKNHDQKLIL